MSLSIEYNLTGRGWSECIVEIDDQKVILTASYLSNAWAELLNAVAQIVNPTFRRLEKISDIYYEAIMVAAIGDSLILNKLIVLRIFNFFC